MNQLRTQLFAVSCWKFEFVAIWEMRESCNHGAEFVRGKDAFVKGFCEEDNFVPQHQKMMEKQWIDQFAQSCNRFWTIEASEEEEVSPTLAPLKNHAVTSVKKVSFESTSNTCLCFCSFSSYLFVLFPETFVWKNIFSNCNALILFVLFFFVFFHFFSFFSLLLIFLLFGWVVYLFIHLYWFLFVCVFLFVVCFCCLILGNHPGTPTAFSKESNIFQEWMFLFQSFNFGSEKLPTEIYVKKHSWLVDLGN